MLNRRLLRVPAIYNIVWERGVVGDGFDSFFTNIEIEYTCFIKFLKWFCSRLQLSCFHRSLDSKKFDVSPELFEKPLVTWPKHGPYPRVCCSCSWQSKLKSLLQFTPKRWNKKSQFQQSVSWWCASHIHRDWMNELNNFIRVSEVL